MFSHSSQDYSSIFLFTEVDLMPVLDVIVGSILGPIIAIGAIILIAIVLAVVGIIMLIAWIMKRTMDKKCRENEEISAK